MAQAIAVSTKTINDMLLVLKKLQRDVAEMKAKLDEAPPYGSDAWWEWSDKKAVEDFEKGDYYELHTVAELKDFLKNTRLKKSSAKYHHKIRRQSREATQETSSFSFA